MLTKRIIPCLDVKDGRVVKGVRFLNLRDAGDPVELAALYQAEGADELVFLDITASPDRRKTVVDMVSKVAEQVSIPFAVGGGIRTTEDMRLVLESGADKVGINTGAVENPNLIAEGATRFGSQCIVVAIDGKPVEPGRWEVFIYGGRGGLEGQGGARRGGGGGGGAGGGGGGAGGGGGGAGGSGGGAGGDADAVPRSQPPRRQHSAHRRRRLLRQEGGDVSRAVAALAPTAPRGPVPRG